MYHAKNEKQKNITEGIELPDQEKIRTFWEKETYKHLGILEVNIINIRRGKKKYFRRTRNQLELNYIEEILSTE